MSDAVQAATTYAAAAATGSGPSIPVVVFTGLVLVFLILVLLTLVLIGEGRLFAWLEAKRKPGKTQAPPPAKRAARPAAPVLAPEIQPGIPPQVVAAIAAAVNQMEAGKYTLRSVRAHSAQGARNNWGLAGTLAATEPF